MLSPRFQWEMRREERQFKRERRLALKQLQKNSEAAYKLYAAERRAEVRSKYEEDRREALALAKRLEQSVLERNLDDEAPFFWPDYLNEMLAIDFVENVVEQAVENTFWPELRYGARDPVIGAEQLALAPSPN